MKKVTRMLAALAAVATMTVSAVPVCAEKLSTNTSILPEEMQELNDLYLAVSEYEYQNSMIGTEPEKVSKVYNYFDENNIVCVKISSLLTTDEIQTIVEKLNKFAVDNNLTDSQFKVIAPDESTISKVNKLNETVALLDEFIDENRLYAFLEIEGYFNEADDLKIIVNVGEWWKADKAIEPIKAFIKEKDIDENDVIFSVLEGGTPPVLGDANGDGTLNIRDCAMISRSLINGTADDLPDTADYNKDGIKNIRDGAAIAKVIAQNKN